MADEFGSVLDYNFNDIPEFSTLPVGDYYVTCTRAVMKEATEDFGAQILLLLEPTEHPDAEDVWHTLWLPKEGDTPKQSARALGKVRDAMDAFSVNYKKSPNIQQFEGQSTWVSIIEQVGKKDGITRNKVSQFLGQGATEAA